MSISAWRVATVTFLLAASPLVGAALTGALATNPTDGPGDSLFASHPVGVGPSGSPGFQVSNWTPVGVPGPSNRSEAAMTYARPIHAASYVLLFGGRRGGSVLSDTWVFQNGSWSRLVLATHPPPTRFGMMAWDAADQEVVLFGGSNYTAYLNDTWKFTLSGGWTLLHPGTSPMARRSGGMVYDVADGYLVLWGGHTSSPPSLVDYQPAYRMLNDTWTFRGGAWTNVTSSSAPTPASEPALVYDPSASAVIEFGGYDQHGRHGYVGLNQTWWFRAGVWTDFMFAVAPGPRDGAAAFYDPLAGGNGTSGIVLVGGQDEGVPGQCLLNGTWVLSGSSLAALAWRHLAPSNLPLMDSATAVYDNAAGAAILFGGTGTSGGVCAGISKMVWYGTTWELF